jgi:hypothetical protein
MSIERLPSTSYDRQARLGTPATERAAASVVGIDDMELPQIRELVGQAVARAEADIRWYEKHARKKAFASRLCRYFGILLAVAGGLCPLLPITFVAGWLAAEPLEVEVGIKSFGFILLALAAGIVILDRVFGYSSSWMRYKLAQVKLEYALERYRIQTSGILAASVDTPDGELAKAIFRVTEEFSATVGGIVLTETEAWISEYRAGLLLERSGRDRSKPAGAEPSAS